MLEEGDMRATMKMPAVTIVAAWISAEIGVGPSMESGQPDVQRDLGRFAHRADEQADADQRERPHAGLRGDGEAGPGRLGAAANASE